MMSIQTLDRQTGSAALMALLVVVIVTAYSTFWFSETRINIQRTEDMLVSEQMHLYADAIVDWGMESLRIDTVCPKIFASSDFSNGNVLLSGRIDEYSLNTQRTLPVGVLSKQTATTSSTDFYLLRAEARYSDQRFILYTLLRRVMIEGKVNIVILWQSRGIV